MHTDLRKMNGEITPTTSHINHHASDAILKNRDLIRTDLSDEQLLDILRKLVNIRIDDGMKLSDALPTTPPKPKLVRQVGEHKMKAPPPSPKKSKRLKKSKKSKKSTKPPARRRFVVQPLPEPETTDFDETTAYEQTDANSEDSSSDSDSD